MMLFVFMFMINDYVSVDTNNCFYFLRLFGDKAKYVAMRCQASDVKGLMSEKEVTDMILF